MASLQFSSGCRGHLGSEPAEGDLSLYMSSLSIKSAFQLKMNKYFFFKKRRGQEELVRREGHDESVFGEP